MSEVLMRNVVETVKTSDHTKKIYADLDAKTAEERAGRSELPCHVQKELDKFYAVYGSGNFYPPKPLPSDEGIIESKKEQKVKAILAEAYDVLKQATIDAYKPKFPMDNDSKMSDTASKKGRN